MTIKHLIRSILLIAVSAFAMAQNAYPPHWGQPPEMETMDFTDLPAGFGKGSSTRKNWIVARMQEDIKANHPERVKNMEGPWHEFVGMKGSDAKHRLSLDCSELNEITVLDQNSMMTMDFRLDRVRIFVDDEGIVVSAPKKG